MQSLVSDLHALEQREDVITATLAMGFPFADIRDAGASVLVTTHDSPGLADQLADEFAGKLWELREMHESRAAYARELQDERLED